MRASDVAGGGLAYSQIGEIQRVRLLAAAVTAVDQLGYANTTVGDITSRARVSRRTFYEFFANRDECLAAVLEDVVGVLGGELATVGLEGVGWRERVRRGLWVILSFFDREPALARVCVVQALRGGPRVLERREGILACLAGVVDEGRLEGGARGGECTALTAEGLVGAAFTIVHARLSRGKSDPLRGLLGELMGMIVLPYLGVGVARRERTRPAPAACDGVWLAGSPVTAGVDPLEGVAMRLTYRTARVLEVVGEHVGASNRQIADHAGITDAGQVSKLLRRLEGLGLLSNSGAGHAKGEPNAWRLTAKGRQVTRGIRVHSTPSQQEAA